MANDRGEFLFSMVYRISGILFWIFNDLMGIYRDLIVFYEIFRTLWDVLMEKRMELF